MKLQRNRMQFAISIVAGILIFSVLGSWWRTGRVEIGVETLFALTVAGLISYLLHPRFFPNHQE
jgi:hypothetical protein